MRSTTRTVLILLPQRVHLLDVAGPAQVFTNAAELGGTYRVCFVAAAPDVVSHQGLALNVTTQWPRLTPDDLVLVAGWKSGRPLIPLPDSHLQALAAHAADCGHLASVCAGAFALAKSGVLKGKQATTHHELVDRLARYPEVQVARDVLFTCDERIHTSAGIASGIDLALHLVTHDHGPALAARVARTLVVPGWRPGGSPQASVMLRHRDHMSDVVHRAQDLLDDPTGAVIALPDLAAHVGVSSRTLVRHFLNATGLTPHAYATAVRRERADELHARGWTRQAAANAVGYADARSLRRR